MSSIATSGEKGTCGLQNAWTSHQNRASSPECVASTSARRLLPSPGVKQESEKARNVRILLAKHQEQVNQLLQLRTSRDSITDASRLEQPFKIEQTNKDQLELLDEDDHYFTSSQIPGNSFPATEPILTATSMVDLDGQVVDEEHDDCEELLKRLRQGQARMEQIKRMLVNQRGFIVELLKKLAQNNVELERRKEESIMTCSSCNMEQGEKDRTLGRTIDDEYLPALESEMKSASQISQNVLKGRLCPMCEAEFPVSVDQEQFELHVMDHFNFEDSETLQYLPEDDYK